MTDSISISGLTHGFGTKVVLNDINLRLQSGEIIGIFGRNGSGKSTLLNVLFGSLKLQKGKIKKNDNEVNPDTLPKHIAYSTQEIFLPPSVTVRNIIPMYFSNGDDQNKIFYAEGIYRLEKFKIGSLSIGEKKYLQFLMTVNLPQKFVLLDEPFAMIDPLYRELVKNRILELSATKAFILTDHYYKDVFEISDHCFLMKDGVLKPVVSIDDLKRDGYLPER